jgi:hypothetical protein
VTEREVAAAANSGQRIVYATRPAKDGLSLATGRRDADVRGTCTIGGSHYAGTRTVPLRQIRGSEGRSEDFDAEFAPVTSHSQWRWLKVASARLQDVRLPPVEPIQVRQVYDVRDGHHRISVVRAWGQESIEAEVTVWDVVGPLPGEQPRAHARICRHRPAAASPNSTTVSPR